MREVAEVEYRSWRCIMCGSTNKMMTVYSYYGEPDAARMMRCCNCGQETFYTRPDRIINKDMLQVSYRKCLKKRVCYHYECPLHPKHDKFKPNNISEINTCTKNQVYPQLMLNCEDEKYK